MSGLLRAAGSDAKILGYDTAGIASRFFSRMAARHSYFRKLARRLPAFDMVHLFGGPGVSFYGWILPLVLITRFFGKRVLLDCGNGVSESGPDEIGQLTRAVLLLCDRVLLASDYQVQQAKSVGLRGVYISGSVDLSLVEPRLIESVQPRIVVAGHLDKISNLRCAIRAFKLVKQKYPRTEMLVIGDGPERARLEVMVAMGKIGGITFTGEIDRDSFV
ncbi:MAG: hypothetical protein KAU36_04175, partial [candidate division Zixibacteria bacterium]|nr:hypothetical protein [candidate division Zixibacteria bacterium]